MIFKQKLFKICNVYRDSTNIVPSCCVGVYIAFSPFIGLHTAMVFLFSWLFRLNVPVTFAFSILINNPWTMVFVYGADYVFGECLFYLVGINSRTWNPVWVEVLNAKINTVVSIPGISFWSFMIGGNLLGILIAGMLYPVFKFIVLRSQPLHHEDSRAQ
jgi:uncharacterized protein (DUF2062 family)